MNLIGKNPDHKVYFQLLNDIIKANTKRNIALHNIWGATSDPHTTTRMSIRAKGKLDYSQETIDFDELMATTDFINDVALRVQSFSDGDYPRKNGS